MKSRLPRAAAPRASACESTQGGWQIYLAMLKYSAEHCRGHSAVQAHVLTSLAVPAAQQWQKLIGAEGGIAIDSLAEGGAYHARIGGIEITGTVIRHPRAGYLCLSAENSVVALFVEKCGPAASMQTIQWMLFGEGAAARAPEVRRALAVFSGAPAGPAEAVAAQT